MRQKTLTKEYRFSGAGLHSGRISNMTLLPAAEDSGIVFVRTDIGPDAEIPALAPNITSTERSTTISVGNASVSTVEHLLSALTGLGIDNARIEIDSCEVPILDGSARLYVEAILPDGLKEQDAERKWIELDREIVVETPEYGSIVRITPAEEFSIDATIDFNSRVVGVQKVHYDFGMDFSKELAPCRTFVFFHEIEYLFSHNLIKGGSVDNAIVIVEYPVSDSQLETMSRNFGQPLLSVTPEGYLSNLVLRFPDECGRHKTMDLLGDLRLCGGFLKAKVTAIKSGHTINSKATKAICEYLSGK